METEVETIIAQLCGCIDTGTLSKYGKNSRVEDVKKRRGEKENLTYILDDETKELLNKYGDISKEDKDYLLAILKESTNYEGFVAVMYSVINRAVKNNKTIAEIVSMPNQYEAFKASEIGVMSEQKNG